MENIYTQEFKQTGVYQIRNKINNKVYIGSTIMSFTKRLEHHRCLLRKGTHKNTYLQHAWNKYGEESFEFSILEVVDKCCTLEREQFYIDTLKPSYNINPLASGTPNLSKETVEKRTKTFTLFIQEAMEFYYKVKNKEVFIEEVPEKYHKTIKSRLSHVVWNKGLTTSDIDYSYLKVPKTKTEKLLKSQKANSELIREKSPEVFVFDAELNFLGKWRSSKDLEEWSMTDENNLPIVLGKVGNRRPHKYLCSGNIMKVFDTDKTYKGLYFKSSLT